MNVNTRSVTIPWGPGRRVPTANLADEAKVRTLVTWTNEIALSHLAVGDVGNGWSKDLDPDPARVLRTLGSGDNQEVLAVETDQPEKPGPEQRPLSLNLVGQGQTLSAGWTNGELVKYERVRKTEHGVNRVTLVVNDNQTLTYSEETQLKA